MKAARRVALALVLTGLVGSALAFWLRPLAVFELLGRAALRGAGLEKADLRSPRGRLVVFRGGQGRTVVLLHGVNDQAGGWAHVAKPLAAHYRVVVPDLPGHGESEPREGALTVSDLLSGLDAVLASEPAPAVLVGNSMGGWLALLTALQHPERVARVVLVNGAAVTGQTTVKMLPADRDEARRTMAALLAPGAPRTPDFVLDDVVRRAPTSPLARLVATSFKDHALDGRLREITLPVSLIWGAEDRLLPPAYAQELARGLPNAALDLLPSCGHMPQRECPDRLLPLLERAIAGTDRKSPQ